MPTILPPELWLEVFDVLVLSHPSYAHRIPNLAALARVNRAFHHLANPLLYEDLFLDSSRRFNILSSLASNPSLLTAVRKITLTGGGMTVEEFDFMRKVLSKCTGVSSLTYLAFDPWYLPSLTAFIGQTWSSSLRYLRSDTKEGLFDLLPRLPNLEELVASRIDFPPSSTRDTSTLSPSFRLKRADFGSTPFASDFELVTRTSRGTLVDLDVPISSRSPLQDLSLLRALSHLTLSLAERYIPHNLDSRIGQPGTPARTERDDVLCLRRVVTMLKSIERPGGGGGEGGSLRHLELYQPDYKRTREISPDHVEEAELLEGIPGSVEELDLSTLEIGAQYLLKAFAAKEDEDGKRAVVCKGLRRIWLKRPTRFTEVERVLKDRGVTVAFSS